MPDKFIWSDKSDHLTARRFALWWLRHRPISPPKTSAIAKAGELTGLVLYREGPFQVQLFTTAGRADIPSHTHPNVDSIEVHIAGTVELSVRGREMQRQDDIDGFLTVGHADNHYGYMVAGAFYSFQKWLNGVPPSSVHLDWVGKPIDTAHADEIAIWNSPTLMRVRAINGEDLYD